MSRIVEPQARLILKGALAEDETKHALKAVAAIGQAKLNLVGAGHRGQHRLDFGYHYQIDYLCLGQRLAMEQKAYLARILPRHAHTTDLDLEVRRNVSFECCVSGKRYVLASNFGIDFFTL